MQFCVISTFKLENGPQSQLLHFYLTVDEEKYLHDAYYVTIFVLILQLINKQTWQICQ